MATSRLMEYFNKQPRIGVLSTASRDGKVDAAVFGSPQMTDEETVIVALGRTARMSLRENPHAVFTIVESGETITDWKGLRVYLRMKEHASSGEMFETYKRDLARAVGEEAAAMIHAVATFEVDEIRPLVDMGQGWEASIPGGSRG